jgi:hypothetical protein
MSDVMNSHNLLCMVKAGIAILFHYLKNIKVSHSLKPFAG